jgi:glycosidase
MKKMYLLSVLATILIAVLAFSITSCKSNKTEEGCNYKTNVKHLDYSKNAVIYEVNIRQFTEEGTFKAFTDHIPRLKELGIDILWIMPVHPIGEIERKGSLGSYYSVKDYCAVNPEFGTMEDFKQMVKVAHDNGMHLIIDWVANHTARDSKWFEEHPDWFVYAEDGSALGPFDWTDVSQLDYTKTEMRDEMIRSMKFWIEEADIDGFRCDVAGMVPVDFWDKARKELDAVKPVFMLAEAEQADLTVNAFDMDYAWEFHSIMNKIAKGEMSAKDIDSYLTKIDTTYPCGVYKMNFITNHDENSWNGTEFERMGDGALTFATLCTTFPGMPLIYTGQEIGMNKRFDFFEKDHVEDWNANSEYVAFYKKLNELRHNNPALWSGCFGGKLQKLTTTDDNAIFAFGREKDDNKVVAIFNLTANKVSFEVEMENFAGTYTEYFDNIEVPLTGKFTIDLDPWDYLVFIK